jgi:CheY-like chemotaxis protein
MPELDGQTFYGRILLHYPSIGQRVIFLTGDIFPENLEFLERCGQPWIPKPCSVAEVRMAIAQVLRRKDEQA